METLDLSQELSQFTGTEYFHRSSPFSKMVHTDGVKHFCDRAGAYWLLDIIASEYAPLLKNVPFQSISLIVNHQKADISVEDGDCKTIKTKHLDYTDCPTGLYRFFLVDNVLMLTSEY